MENGILIVIATVVAVFLPFSIMIVPALFGYYGKKFARWFWGLFRLPQDKLSLTFAGFMTLLMTLGFEVTLFINAALWVNNYSPIKYDITPNLAAIVVLVGTVVFVMFFSIFHNNWERESV